MDIDTSLIKDIPSMAKALKNARDMAAFKRIMPYCRPFLKLLGVDEKKMDDALDKVDDLVRQIEEMSQIPDRFNDLFALRGWIIYDLLNLEVAKAAIAKADSGDIDGAETDLVNYYSAGTVRWKLQTMKEIHAFRPRIPLAQKALVDYEEERYHACVPVVLALLDGLVNELYEKRRGFFAEGVDLTAWDSISAHSLGLQVLKNLFQTSRKTTRIEPIDIPYRNGIMHGMDLGYDNKMVAAKTWAALFATHDWALKVEKGLIEPPPEEPQKTWNEIQQQQCENEVSREKLEQWRSRDITVGVDVPETGSPDRFLDATPEKRLAEYFRSWEQKNYGYMAKYLSVKLGPPVKKAPTSIRKIFESKTLQSFKFISIVDSAPGLSTISTELVFEEYGKEVKKFFDFRLINENSKGEPEMRGTPNSAWKIINWELY
ncbi:hypothetical protein E5S67_03462 [Microcoleus sp. IPMA8]|uniref:Uncharacterized protein n=2 Tax=Microcoleus TaxID=44471 RepID=A0ABX2CZA6_9CYAN|nr:hypothetical protein [Microcoleus asticus]NQE35727.1 hypothetical protein [Microcoleus asticus IPMA8]